MNIYYAKVWEKNYILVVWLLTLLDPFEIFIWSLLGSEINPLITLDDGLLGSQLLKRVKFLKVNTYTVA